MPNSQKESSHEICSRCNQKFTVDIWFIIDKSERPDLFDKVVNGNLYNYSCPNCQTGISIDTSLLIYQPDNYHPLIFSPSIQVPNEQIAQQAIMLLIFLCEKLGRHWQDSWLTNVPVVPRIILKDVLLNTAKEIDHLYHSFAEFKPHQKIPTGLEQYEIQIKELEEITDKNLDVITKKIELLNTIINQTSANQHPMYRALRLGDLGEAYTDLRNAERARNLRKAIDCYEEALSVITLDTSLIDFGRLTCNLGKAYADLPNGNRSENLAKAISYYQQSLLVYTERADPKRHSIIQNNLGATYIELALGDRSENVLKAIDCYNKALSLYGDQDQLFQAMVLNNLGKAYFDLPTGNRDENLQKSASFYKDALKVYAPETTPYDYAMTQGNLGIALVNRGPLFVQEAIESYKEALKVYTEKSSPIDYARIMVHMGNAYSTLPTEDRLANLQLSVNCFLEALRFYSPDDMPNHYSRTMNNIANSYYALFREGRPEYLHLAIDCYKKALSFRSVEEDPLNCRITSTNLANVYFREQLWQDALKFYKLALKAGEQLYRFSFQPESMQVEIQENSVIYAMMIQTCLNLTNDPSSCIDGLVAAEESKGRLFLNQVGRTNFPRPAEFPLDLIQQEEQLLSQLRNLEHTLYQPSYQEEEKIIIARQCKVLQDNLDSLWQKMLSDFPQFQEYLALRRGKAPTWEDIEQLSKRLGPGIALVEFFVLDNEIAVFIMNSDWIAPQVIRIPITSHRIFQRYIESYNSEILQRTPNRYSRHDWLDLGEEILTPLMGLLGNVNLVYFIPHSWMHLVPLHALSVNGKPFIAHKAVAYTPSIAALSRTLARINISREINNPLVVGFTPSEDVIEREIFLGEANDIATYFNVTPQLDGDATPEQIIDSFDKSGLIHLSCHGYYNRQDPLASSVILASGEITAREWMSQNLRSQLVTLSACQTGFGEVGIGDDISGFSRAILHAGSKSALLTLWSVNAQTTREWMSNFYMLAWNKSGQSLMSKAQAFQKATLILRKKYTDPYYWAPFMLIGNAD